MSLADVMEPQLALIWADGTNTSSDTHPSPTDVMNIVLQPLSPAQRAAVHQVATPDDIATSCPQNFNLFSECFAGVAFNSFPTPSNATTGTTLANTTILKVGPQPPTGPSMQLPNGTQVLPPSSLLNYTISGDGGLGFIDVVDHKSDFEVRVLPLQWAIDSVSHLISFIKEFLFLHCSLSQYLELLRTSQTRCYSPCFTALPLSFCTAFSRRPTHFIFN